MIFFTNEKNTEYQEERHTELRKEGQTMLVVIFSNTPINTAPYLWAWNASYNFIAPTLPTTAPATINHSSTHNASCNDDFCPHNRSPDQQPLLRPQPFTPTTTVAGKMVCNIRGGVLMKSMLVNVSQCHRLQFFYFFILENVENF